MKLNKTETTQGDDAQGHFSGLASAEFMRPQGDGVLFFSFISTCAVPGEIRAKGKVMPTQHRDSGSVEILIHSSRGIFGFRIQFLFENFSQLREADISSRTHQGNSSAREAIPHFERSSH